MPVVNIELVFDDKGAVVGARKMDALADAADRVQKSAAGSAHAVAKIGNSAKNAAFRVQGFVVQLLALAGAYKAVQGVGSYFNRTFDFSSNMESSRVAIASVIGATNKITNAQGRALEGAEKFNAAQELSAKLMDEIQIQALETTATFDDLVAGVSGIIAPAAKAGVSLEKMPKFAVTAAQAMTAMKIPVQQMRTEIESLLSGNINKAQDILATNLGITGEMVRNWQQQGILVEELEKKLRVFAEAGEATAQTWNGLKSNLQDAFDYLSLKTGHGMFEGAKQSYRELLDLMINTQNGKLGVGKDISNIVDMVKELQDEIGDRLIAVTRDFIEYIRELNRPENIENLKKDFKEFSDLVIGTGKDIAKVGSAIASIAKTSLDGWRELPEIIQELGIVGAIAFGLKGRLALAGIGIAAKELKELGDWVKSHGGWGDSVPWNLEDELPSDPSEGTRNPIQKEQTPAVVFSARMPFAKSHGKPPQKKEEYKVESSIGGFGGKNGGSGSSGAESARERIARLREEIAQLNGEAAKSSNSLAQKEREIAKLGKEAGLSAQEIGKLQDDYSKAFDTNALKELNKELLRAEGNTKALQDAEKTESLAMFTARLDGIKSLSEDEKKIMLGRYESALGRQSAVKDAQTSLAFARELAQLSGDYGIEITHQNKMLDAQAEIYRAQLGPELRALVDEWLKLKKMESARDPLSGSMRGLRRYANEATDLGKGVEDAWVNGFSAMEDAMTQFVLKGKMDFNSLANSIINDLTRIAIRSMITGPLASGLGSLFSGMFGGTYSATQTSTMASNGMVWSGGSGSWLNGIHGHAKGGVLSGGNLSLYSNSVVTSPTLFSFGNRLSAFASGAGLMGEAGPEAIMPLRRGANGRLGVEMFPSLGRHADFTPRQLSHQQITINFIDRDGNRQQQTARSDGMGNMTIDVFINEIDKGLAQRVSQGKSQTARALDASRGLNSARQLYN